MKQDQNKTGTSPIEKLAISVAVILAMIAFFTVGPPKQINDYKVRSFADAPVIQQVIVVTNEAEFRAAIAAAEAGTCTVISVNAQVIQLTQPLILPRSMNTRNRLRRLEIDGNGCTLQVMAAMEYALGREKPLSQADAINFFQSQGFTIKGLFIDCRQMAQYGILMRSTYHDFIQHVTVVGATAGGIVERFGMNCIIDQCEVRACMGYGIALLPGDHTGAGANNAGCNMGTVRNSRVFPLTGMYACFALIRAGNSGLYDNIVDFAQYKNAAGQMVDEVPMRGFLIDNSGSTTCKLNIIDRFWLESITSIAGIEVIGAGGLSYLAHGYPQKGPVMVKVSGTNYHQVVIEGWGNITGKFMAALNNGVVWRFNNNATSYDFANPVNWVNGLLPVNFVVERFGTDQSWQYQTPSNRTLKHNSKTILTQ